MPMNDLRQRLRSASERMWAANSYSLIPSAGSASGFLSRMDWGMTCEISSSTDFAPITSSMALRSFSLLTPMWRSENLSNIFVITWLLWSDAPGGA